jgi:hypothetical protein
MGGGGLGLGSMIEHLPKEAQDPEFKPQSCQKKNTAMILQKTRSSLYLKSRDSISNSPPNSISFFF